MSEGMKWRVNRAVRQSTLLPAPARHIMLNLAERAKSDTAAIPPEFSPSTAELMAETGQKETTVKKYRGFLEVHGWLKVERPTGVDKARHVPSTYQLAAGVDCDGVACQHSTKQSEGRETTLETTSRGSGDDPRRGSSPDPRNDSEGRETTVARVAKRPSRGSGDDPLPITDQNHQNHLTTATADADGEDDGALFPVADSDRRSAPKADPAERFPEFYKTYPRKKAPGRAEAMWIKAVKAGAEPQVIIEAAERFAAWCSRTKQGVKFIPYPATWLNDHSWDDEDEPAHTEQRPGQHSPWQDNRDDPRPYAGEL